MRFYPTKIHTAFACLFLISIALILGCSKDTDLLVDSILEDPSITSIEERQAGVNSLVEQETAEELDGTTEETLVESFEIRTASFSPTNDAHVQSGKGYNQNIIRLEENHRTSYLMFDLNPIIDVSGIISTATLQITINSDDGNGNISVHKGASNNWTEEDLSEDTAPEAEVLIGELIKDYKIGTTEIIELDASGMQPEVTTLVLSHKNGNDLAFASKEHFSKIGPKLVVTYSVPTGSDEILMEEGEEEVTTEETTTTEEIPTEETGTEEPTQNQEPMAIADATPASGGMPLEVTFKGSNSTDDSKVDSYVWDFKDGSSATAANPTHTFTTAGVYEVELTVNDQQGLSNADTVTITVTETENEAPKAVVSATPVSGEAPLEVRFAGSSSTDDHSIATYGWDFKDGSRTNIADFTYTYTTPGTYDAELTVTDENGLVDKETVTITVLEAKNEAPIAIATANISSGPAPLAVQFLGDKSTDDVGITSYAWDYKDGTTAVTANPSHTFTQEGTYQVELTVVDEDGLSSKKTVTISIFASQNQPPIAQASANPTSGQAPLNVQFVGNSSTDDKAVTSYFWDFKDGSSATSSNPSHTFTQAGSYSVDLTVKDTEGANSTKSVIINVTAADTGGGNAPPGLYVATNGNSSNNGQSPSSPWSLEHAFNTARAGDIVYVKAGNYGNKQLLTKSNGNASNPVKFIGYRSSPGDVSSGQGSTFNFGDSVDASKMPLLNSSNGLGTAITIHHAYIHFENFQINAYATGIQSINNGRNATLKNIIIMNSGNQGNSSSYQGFGMSIRGNNSLIENSIVINATAEAIKLFDADYSVIRNSEVHGTNAANPTDYYFLIAGGTTNALVENCKAVRSPYLSHGGHGFNIKNDGSYNTFKNCTAIRTNFELTYSGVHHNTISGGAIYGVNTSSSNWHAGMAIYGGAHHNTINGLLIQDTWTAIALATYDDRSGADASLGSDNTFQNVTVKNTNRILNVGGGTNYNAVAKRYKFNNCNFENFDAVAVMYYKGEGFEFNSCSFNTGNKLIARAEGVYMSYNTLSVSWNNCSWSNVNFSPPN